MFRISSRDGHGLSVVVIATLVGIAALISCCVVPVALIYQSIPVGVDSGKHYSQGGMFVTDSPSLSEEGSQMVFATPATGNGDVYVTDVKSGTTQRKTFGDEFECSPYFLPGMPEIVFERESVPYRHIWLLDLATANARQLTQGRVIDDIMDVSPTGQHLLIGRSTNWGPGRLLTPHLLSLRTGKILEIKGCVSARFVEHGNALLVTHGGERMQVARASLEGVVDAPIVDGSLRDVCDAAELAVIIGDRAGEPPNQEIHCLNLATQQTHFVGFGHSARVFPNGKVLYFVGWNHTAMIWESGMTQARQIASPAGYKYWPNRAAGAAAAGVFIMPPNEANRALDAYIFDSTTEQFTPVAVNMSR